MSFAKIAEARAVKKIVAMIRARAEMFSGPRSPQLALLHLADEIEKGGWKDIKLPKPEPKKKGKKK